MEKAFGIITSTPRRVNVYGLQDTRPAGDFSFLGRYRVIDFPISNLSNSGIDNIQVYLNRHPRALTRHLGTGGQYNINSKSGHLQLLFCEHGITPAYDTDVSHLTANMDYIDQHHQKYVVITPCYMVFKQDFDELLSAHVASGADITMLYHKVNNAKDHFLNCRVLSVDAESGKVSSLSENRANRQSQNVFMDTYILKKDLLKELLKKAAEASSTYSMGQYLAGEIEDNSELDIRGIAHKGYFAAIDDLQAYYDANLELLDPKVADSLFSSDWPFYTKTSDSAPTKIEKDARVTNSFVSDGGIIAGTVEHSILGRGVEVGKGAVVKNSIVLAGTVLGEGVHLDSQIIDKGVTITKTKSLVSTSVQPGYVKKNDKL